MPFHLPTRSGGGMKAGWGAAGGEELPVRDEFQRDLIGEDVRQPVI